ncbi:hypothetical protein [Sutcliffiella rhizosphaerae]|uniref:Permuted papain-like amidase YaeF/Yiix C92 family enzyme n=1 Tax=Sutcliffiella rhizosphaerae TaxID=2880967 RepID=A0ABN8A8G9_9BACI|nr:hypothetical protein [Sutcliffiella rhizosphaerae]CAG9620681.1 hypothetical protein BACCIP111883_01450 [Sutcliffiella rhizosphaerae]
MNDTHVYILLTDTGTLFTKSIKKYTKAPYNHVSLSFDPNLEEMYSFGRKRPSNPFHGGFVRENVETGTYRKYPETTCVLYKMKVTAREIEKMRRVISIFQRKEKKWFYNLLGVIGVSINEPVEIDSSYFCSQFVSDVLHRSGIKLWNKLPSLVTPDDFRQSERLEWLYEGKLFDYEPIKLRMNR